MSCILQGEGIMDVGNGPQERITKEAGAYASMALEWIPKDIKADGGIARMSDPNLITEIMETESIPVMVKSRIGHFGESKIIETLGVDNFDESEVLIAADEKFGVFW